MTDYVVDRPDWSELTAERLAPIEGILTPAWPDVWRDFARSHYVTLTSLPDMTLTPEQAARMAAALTLGVAEDLGGTQPYIPVGSALASSARAERVIDLLQRGVPYNKAAAMTGLTESRVRKLERAWRRRQMEMRQGQLDLG